jgi:hypothetical protein
MRNSVGQKEAHSSDEPAITVTLETTEPVSPLRTALSIFHDEWFGGEARATPVEMEEA